MLPLRFVALSSNILFASYGFVEQIYPVLILHTILFPVNLIRLAQVRQLGREIRANTDADISMDKLIPFMRLRKRFSERETSQIASSILETARWKLVNLVSSVEQGS